jgi:enoyl-[acyl-carrier protein] reductase III
MLPFQDKITLVTGSGRGIGRAIAVHFARLGSDMVVNFFRNRAPAEETAGAIRQLGRRALLVKAKSKNCRVFSTRLRASTAGWTS